MYANRLCVVDDDDDVCVLIRDVAERIGFSVSVAHSEAEFVRASEQAKPSTIVLDLHLPGTDGVELLRRLAEQRCRAAIYLVSGFDNRVLNTARQLALGLGLDVRGMLAKPFPVRELERQLRSAMQTQQALGDGELRDALATGELVLHYQPKVVLEGTEPARPGARGSDWTAGHERPAATIDGWLVDGVEALLRWQHPGHGLLPPSRFLRLAETSGQLEALTVYVIEAVLTQIAAWREEGFEPSVAVNLPPQLLADLGLPDRLAQLVRDRGVDCRQIMLEVTESGVTADVVHGMEVLSRLRLKGFGLSIDDFGTGYSSLVQLYRMPFSELKIDRSFVADVLATEEAATIVRSTVDLAHNLGMTVCAEGVENGKTATLLTGLGCDRAQGFYFARPLPAAELMPRLRAAGHPVATKTPRSGNVVPLR